MERETRLVHAGRDPERQEGIVNPPLYRASTILYPTMAAYEGRHERRFTAFAYGIHGTPTTVALAEALAELSGGARTLLLSSGLSAVTQTLTAFLRRDDHLLIADTVYGPTRVFCTQVLARYGVEVTFYDPRAGAGIAGLIRPNTRVVYLESPGSQTFEVQDVPAIATAARARGALVVLDNTWATPLHFRAFEHGVDVEIQALTKFVAGHSDLLLGAVTTRSEDLYRSPATARRRSGTARRPTSATRRSADCGLSPCASVTTRRPPCASPSGWRAARRSPASFIRRCRRTPAMRSGSATSSARRASSECSCARARRRRWRRWSTGSGSSRSARASGASRA